MRLKLTSSRRQLARSSALCPSPLLDSMFCSPNLGTLSAPSSVRAKMALLSTFRIKRDRKLFRLLSANDRLARSANLNTKKRAAAAAESPWASAASAATKRMKKGIVHPPHRRRRLVLSFAQSVKSPPRVLRRRAAKEKLGGIFLTFFLRLSAFSYEIIRRRRLSCLPALQHSSNDFEHFGEGGGGVGERARDPFLLSVREYGSQRFLMSL